MELDDLKCSGGDDDDDDDEIARNLRIGDVHEPDNDTDLETVETWEAENSQVEEARIPEAEASEGNVEQE